MKNLSKTIITFVMVLGIITNSFAATYVDSIQNNTRVKNPTGFSYKDLIRLEEIAASTSGKQVKVVNAVKYNNNKNIWIVRLKYGIGDEVEYADFVLTTLAYAKDSNSDTIISLPFKTIEEGCEIYGPKWYYYGIYDDTNHNSCGFIVAERIKRWSKWSDLNFTGKNKKGINYYGNYNEECSENFLEEHIEE